MQTPQRPSLVAQVADLIRCGIRDGEWPAHLPAERELCQRFKVSRGTVRAALSVLSREGVILAGQGKRRRVPSDAKRITRRARSNVIGVLWMGWAAIQEGYQVFLFRELEHHLRAAGFEIEFHMGAALRGPQCGKRLQALVHGTRACCWLIKSAPEQVQHWFSSHNVPTILAGSPYAGAQFPSFDADFRAVCRHAAQAFWNLGHRRAVLLIPQSGSAGDLRSEQGFREIFAAATDDAGLRAVVHHNGTLVGIQRVVDTMFRTKAAPTAILATQTTHVLAVLTHLLKSGMGVPRDVSLISRDDDEVLNFVTPSIGRYVFDRELYVSRLARAVIQLARGGTVAARETLLYPRFQKGESLAPPRSS